MVKHHGCWNGLIWFLYGFKYGLVWFDYITMVFHSFSNGFGEMIMGYCWDKDGSTL